MNFYVNAAKANAADAALTPQTRFGIQPDGSVGIGAIGIKPDGKLLSPMWRATEVMNQRQGPLPQEATFESGGGTLVIMFSGSAFSDKPCNIGIMLGLDGMKPPDIAQGWSNVTGHKAFVTNMIVKRNVAAGMHRIELVTGPGVITDPNCWFNVTVLELPF
jgi:hypothetical protein